MLHESDTASWDVRYGCYVMTVIAIEVRGAEVFYWLVDSQGSTCVVLDVETERIRG
jgi:hypothetical protein